MGIITNAKSRWRGRPNIVRSFGEKRYGYHVLFHRPDYLKIHLINRYFFLFLFKCNCANYTQCDPRICTGLKGDPVSEMFLI